MPTRKSAPAQESGKSIDPEPKPEAAMNDAANGAATSPLGGLGIDLACEKPKRRRGPGRPFVKGAPSPNPSGRPKDIYGVAEMARERGRKCILKLESLMDDPNVPAKVQHDAAISLLDRGFGRPAQAMAHAFLDNGAAVAGNALLRAARHQPAKPDARHGAGGGFSNSLAEAKAMLGRAEQAAQRAAEIPGGGVSGMLAEALLENAKNKIAEALSKEEIPADLRPGNRI